MRRENRLPYRTNQQLRSATGRWWSGIPTPCGDSWNAHDDLLAPRVRREARNKLETGRKNRRSALGDGVAVG
jgi:hypothetical protein